MLYFNLNLNFKNFLRSRPGICVILKQPKILIYFIFLTGLLSSCSPNDSNKTFGYIEARLTNISCPLAGQLIELNIQRGDKVKTGDILFVLEQTNEKADLAINYSEINQAKAVLADLKKGLRPSEIQALQDQKKQEQANFDFLSLEVNRYRELKNKNAIDQESLDKIITNANISKNKLSELTQNIITGNLAARIDQIKAAEMKVQMLIEQLNKTKWAVTKKTVTAPSAGEIFDCFYQLGEEIPDHQPIASLLVNRDIYALFYVPYNKLSQLKLGQIISIKTDGNPIAQKAKISFIASIAEYTPPVIYSQYSRDKLVFRIEATFETLDSNQIPETLHPGQPIDVFF